MIKSLGVIFFSCFIDDTQLFTQGCVVLLMTNLCMLTMASQNKIFYFKQVANNHVCLLHIVNIWVWITFTFNPNIFGCFSLDSRWLCISTEASLQRTKAHSLLKQLSFVALSCKSWKFPSLTKNVTFYSKDALKYQPTQCRSVTPLNVPVYTTATPQMEDWEVCVIDSHF